MYQEGFGEEGDPEDIINNEGLYALVDESSLPDAEIKEGESGVDEKAGMPVPIPVSRYAIQKDLETGEISIYDEKGNLVGLCDIPDNWKDFIVKDEDGMPITDPSEFLNIDPIGKNKYEIKGLAQEMEDPDGGVWKIMYDEDGGGYNDEKLVDNIMKIGDNNDEIAGGFIRGEDGTPHAVIIVDEDVFRLYNGDFGYTGRRMSTERSIKKEECYDTGKGIYISIYDLSTTEERVVPINGQKTLRRLCVHSPYPQVEDSIIAQKNGHRCANLVFAKTES